MLTLSREWSSYKNLAHNSWYFVNKLPHGNLAIHTLWNIHWVKSVQIRSYFRSVFSFIRTEYGDLLISVFSPNTGRYGPEITPYLDSFHAVISFDWILIGNISRMESKEIPVILDTFLLVGANLLASNIMWLKSKINSLFL